jgi:hypothetical protein
MFSALLGTLNINPDLTLASEESLISATDITIDGNTKNTLALSSTKPQVSFIQNIKDKYEINDVDQLRSRRKEKSGWSQDMLTNRISIPDSTYFNTLRRNLSSQIIGQTETAMESVLTQVSRSFQDILSSNRIGSDSDKEFEIIQPNARKSKQDEDSKQSDKIEFLGGSVMTSTITSQNSSKIDMSLLSGADGDVMGVTICPLPTRDQE